MSHCRYCIFIDIFGGGISYDTGNDVFYCVK